MSETGQKKHTNELQTQIVACMHKVLT